MNRAQRRAAARRDGRAASKILPPGLSPDLVERMNAKAVELYGYRIGELTMAEHRARTAVTRAQEQLDRAPFGRRGGPRRRLRAAQEQLGEAEEQLRAVAQAVATGTDAAQVAQALGQR